MRNGLVIIMACVLIGGCAAVDKGTQPQTMISQADDSLVEVYEAKGDYTGKQLKEIAVKKGIIYADADYAYFQEHKTAQNSAAIWLVYPRDEKVAVVDGFKRIFKLRGAVVSRPSDYYVDRINAVLFLRIQRGRFDIAKEKGIVNIFKTIAIFEGDYDDGRNKAVILRQWVGEDNFQILKKEYPEEYNKLLGQ